MTAVDVAELLGLPRSTVEDWARRSLIPQPQARHAALLPPLGDRAWLTAEDCHDCLVFGVTPKAQLSLSLSSCRAFACM